MSDLNWTFPPTRLPPAKQRGLTMKVKLGEREIELHVQADVPILNAIGALQAMNPRASHTLKTLAGESVELRCNDTQLLLQQVVDAA